MKDHQLTPSFRKELSFLSNMYLCSIKARVKEKDYTFSSAENLYQSLKCPGNEDLFATVSPSEAKKLSKTLPMREDWDSVKLELMEEIVLQKFSQNEELKNQLMQCDFQIVERNLWNDTYWGVCNGVGENHLGNILEKFKCKYLNIPFVSSQEYAVTVGKEMLQKQEDLSKEYKYKKLPSEKSLSVREEYSKKLPDFFMFDRNMDKKLHSHDGVLLARKWNRVVIGDYGAFVEIEDTDICRNNIVCKQGEEYRIDDPKYSENVKYQWFIPKTGCDAKLYFQQRGVTYADYQAGKWYISPYDLKEGEYISEHEAYEQTQAIEKSLPADLEQALNCKQNELPIPDETLSIHIETTGVTRSAEVLKISVCDLNRFVYLDTFVKPQYAKRWNEAERIHHISPAMVANAPVRAEVASQVRDLMESATKIISFNPPYDKRMIEQSFGVVIPKEKFFDVKKAFEIDFPESKHSFADAITSYLGQNYSTASKSAMVLAQIYNAIIDNKKEQNQEDDKELE